jgi:hypothetical protein
MKLLENCQEKIRDITLQTVQDILETKSIEELKPIAIEELILDESGNKEIPNNFA